MYVHLNCRSNRRPSRSPRSVLRRPALESAVSVLPGATHSLLPTTSNRGSKKLKSPVTPFCPSKPTLLIAVASRQKQSAIRSLAAPRVPSPRALADHEPTRRGESRIMLSNRQLSIRTDLKSFASSKTPVSNRQKSGPRDAPRQANLHLRAQKRIAEHLRIADRIAF